MDKNIKLNKLEKTVILKNLNDPEKTSLALQNARSKPLVVPKGYYHFIGTLFASRRQKVRAANTKGRGIFFED